MVVLQLAQIHVPPGQRVLLRQVNWQQFESILAEMGECRATRLAYSKGTLEIVTPLPEHEQTKVVIADLLKVLLDEFDRNWEPLGSTTFRREDMQALIEPDECFYIQNHAAMIGRERVDLSTDPPPDLVIEVDVTSSTQISAYEALKVPEIWRYSNRQLQIYILQDGRYIESYSSPTFPNFPVLEGINEFLAMSRTAGTRPSLKAFRTWIRQRL